jgi:hypothetical protein
VSIIKLRGIMRNPIAVYLENAGTIQVNSNPEVSYE